MIDEARTIASIKQSLAANYGAQVKVGRWSDLGEKNWTILLRCGSNRTCVCVSTIKRSLRRSESNHTVFKSYFLRGVHMNMFTIIKIVVIYFIHYISHF